MTDQDYFIRLIIIICLKWVENHEKLTLLQAIKIINYRMKNKNNDSDNLKPEDINIDATIESVKNKK